MSLVPPDKVRTLQRKLYVKAKMEPTFRFYLLYDKVYRADILKHAYRLARRNGGAAGVDGVTFADIEASGLEEWLRALGKELHERTYQPDPVRRVMLPKPGGGERPLGIPTIRDRVVQTAAHLVLEPVFEADFEDSAHGYRPRRSAQGAVQEVHRALCEGFTDVVDADLSKYFDTIPHAELLRAVARRIADHKMLKLLRMWLKAPVEERDERGHRRLTGGRRSKRGTPQGGVISPLLANIYINRFLRAWRERGKGEQYRARIVNYADDFVILSRGCADEALRWTRWAMRNLELALNEEKTCLRDAQRERFDFLGYTFGPERHRRDGHWYLAAQPSQKAVRRLKHRVRGILRPGNPGAWPEVVTQLNRTLRGWANYFNQGTRYLAYRAVDNYVYHAVRNFRRRRHRIRHPGTARCLSNAVIFEELGVVRLRTVHLAPPS